MAGWTSVALVCVVLAAEPFETKKTAAGHRDSVALRTGDLAVTVAPKAGCNVASLRYKDREILRQPPSAEEQAGFLYGVPLLYPTPNRVRNSTFTFVGRTYSFTPNNNGHFLHGLVHSAPFTIVDRKDRDGVASATFELPFRAGDPWFERFPHEHVLRVAVDVFSNAVRWTYTVDNSKGEDAVPYGFGIHPWFLYQGSRAQTRLTVPATHWMHAVDLLPTGQLAPLEGSPFDARHGRSLEGFVIDDVYFGMTTDQPARIHFEQAGLAVTLKASPEFTHLVVYTPEEPWFCVENQTCSTDAHNLYAKGFEKESHLLIVPAGQSRSGWVEMRFEED